MIRLLLILHYPPPLHGASKIGTTIINCQKLRIAYNCKFIKIKSSDEIEEGGKVSLKKIVYFFGTFIEVFWTLVTFKPQKIYFTASTKNIAFYRDLILSLLWKSLGMVKTIDVYYHYHTKGTDVFVSSSFVNLKLRRFFLKNVNLILLSPLLEQDYEKVHTYNKAFYLPNGVKNPLDTNVFETMIKSKYKDMERIEVLFLSHMMKEKGYFEILNLAGQTKNDNIHYNFAGKWKNAEDEKEFFEFVTTNSLDRIITFHGFA